MTTPLPPASNGRDSRTGRFTTGNPGGAGNPNLKRVHALRNMLLAKVTDADFDEVLEKLIGMAKGGDLDAIKELLNRLLGRPVAAVEVSGPDGEALGVNLADVQLAVWESLKDEPAARQKVAAGLRKLAQKGTNGPAHLDGTEP
jgi:hypothetical protein